MSGGGRVKEDNRKSPSLRRIFSRARASSCFSRWRSSTLRFKRCSSSVRCACISSFVARRCSASRTFSSSLSSFCAATCICQRGQTICKILACFKILAPASALRISPHLASSLMRCACISSFVARLCLAELIFSSSCSSFCASDRGKHVCKTGNLYIPQVSDKYKKPSAQGMGALQTELFIRLLRFS